MEEFTNFTSEKIQELYEDFIKVVKGDYNPLKLDAKEVEKLFPLTTSLLPDKTVDVVISEYNKDVDDLLSSQELTEKEIQFIESELFMEDLEKIGNTVKAFITFCKFIEQKKQYLSLFNEIKNDRDSTK